MKSLFPFLNKKGNAMLLAIVAIAVMGPAFYSFSVYLLSQKKQITKNTKLLQQKFALHSAMDYVIFGIKQKYCFDSLLLNDLPTNCNLNHPGSVERIIMSSDQENSIRNNIAGGINVGPYTLNSLHLDSFTNTVQISSLTTLHPLYQVMNAALVSPISGIYVKIERDNTRNIPRNGKEMFLKITVEFTDANGNHPVTFGNLSMTQTSYLSIYPREVSSFALLIPGDLYLDRAYNTNVPNGSSVIHSYNNGFQQNVTGLLFDSPVFVNYNIHLPYVAVQNGGHQNNANAYSPVTFADRVFLGNGYVFENGQVYEPNSAGGAGDRLWSQNKLIGGLLRGIEIDGGLDNGLSVFGGVTNSTVPNTTLMDQCIQYFNNLSNSMYLNNNSDLRSYLQASQNQGKYQNFRITLDRNDRFSPQANQLLPLNNAQWGTGTASRTVPQNVTNGAIINVSVYVGNKSVTGQLPSGGILNLSPEVGSPTVLANLTAIVNTDTVNLQNGTALLTNYQNNLNVQQNQLNQYNTNLQTAQNQVQTLQQQNQTNQAAINQNNNQISTLQAQAQNQTGNQLQNTLNQISNLQNQNTTFQNQIQANNTQINQLNTVTIPNLQNQIQNQNQVVNTAQNQVNQQQQVVNQLTQQLNQSQSNLANYNFKVQNPPQIQIKVTDYYNNNNNNQAHKKNLEITITHPSHMLDQNGAITAPVIGILAYNPTYANSMPLQLPQNMNADLFGYYNYQLNNNNNGYHLIQAVSRTAGGNLANMGVDPIQDMEQFVQTCHAQANVMPSQAFGGAAWNVDFSSQTRHSWNFAGSTIPVQAPNPLVASYTFDATNSSIQNQNVKFQVRSIVGSCVVKPTAELVTGFFACDSMVIQARATPLRVIGSFIVGSLTIHPSALQHGIRWSTIYHPQAVYELRNAGVLKTISGAACSTPTSPVWHPIPSFQEVSDRYSCGVHSLRSLADPFQWTAVDPDCGLLAGNSNNTCKNRMIRFYAVELSREGGL